MIVYAPKTLDGKIKLAKRVASVHADVVTRRIQKLNIPTAQKLQLLDAVIEEVKRRPQEPIR